MSNQAGFNLQGGVERVLAELTVGVGRDQNYIAERALTPYDVKSMDYIIRTSGNEGLVHVGKAVTLRAPGEKPETIRKKTSTTTSRLNEHMLGWSVDMTERERALQIGQDAADALYLERMGDVINQIEMTKEQEIADLLFTSTNYNGGTNVTNGTNFNASDIRKTIRTKLITLSQTAGVDASRFRIVAGTTANEIILANAAVQDMIKYVKGGVTTEALIADFFGVSAYLVGTSAKQTAASPGDAGTPTAFWTADSLAIYYASDRPRYNDASFAYLRYMNFTETGVKAFVNKWTDQSLLFEEGFYGERFRGDTGLTKSGWLYTGITAA